MLDMMPSVPFLVVALSSLLLVAGVTATPGRSSSAFCATNVGGVDAAMATAAWSTRKTRWRWRIANDIIVVSRWKTMMTTTTTDDKNSGAEFHTHPRGRTYTVLDDYRGGRDAENNCIDGIDERRRDLRWDDMQHVLRTMERAAYLAGELALSTSGSIGVHMTKANSRDLVTKSDLECQRLVKDVIMTEFPNDEFWGEENIDDTRRYKDDDDVAGVGIGDGSSDSIVNCNASRKSLDMTDGNGNEGKLLFIVDPIDGTTNFQAGLPIYAVSIGAVSLTGSIPEVVAGVIYNPALGEMTSAVRGRGCYLNNERIGNSIVRKCDDEGNQQPRKSLIGESLVNVGFPVCRESTLLASSRAVAALATRVRGLRMVACASQTMAWVAQSKFNSYFSWDLNAWDVAAGIVIIEEAGGSVCNFDGTRADVTSRDMIMTCRPERRGEEGLLRDEILRVLNDSDCLRY